MPRVSEETISKLQAFLDSLPDEARNKCALCNETLTHIVKRAEAQTGAGTATVTRELAKRIDGDAAPGGRPDGERLRKRVEYQEENIRRKSPNNPEPPHFQPEPKREVVIETAKEAIQQKTKTPEKEVMQEDDAVPGTYGMAMRYAQMAVMDLERIHDGHSDKNEAYDYVIEWINKNR